MELFKTLGLIPQQPFEKKANPKPSRWRIANTRHWVKNHNGRDLTTKFNAIWTNSISKNRSRTVNQELKKITS
ncbi:hypothetical protein [Sphingobacterium sp. E70]|uniref:hypothetical protein n=1 Tax=Sphingobacterium sp. E70 TaxID=2853439 RepID=UPI002795CC1A|nr:hypothetical protein [Sphingobacterium sp. E70]